MIDARVTSHTQSFFTYCISTVTFDNATLRSKPYVILISVNALAVPFPVKDVGRCDDWIGVFTSFVFLYTTIFPVI